MARPKDEDYYVADRTEHVAQGDIFQDLRFHHPMEPAEVWFEGYGILLNYTSSMLVGAEGANRLYRHPFRVVAPLFQLGHIQEVDAQWTPPKIEQLRGADNFGGWMYLPAVVGDYEEGAAAIFRPDLFVQDQLEGRRVAQLGLEATRHLQLKLGKVYAGFDALNPADLNPDMRDHWEGAPR